MHTTKHITEIGGNFDFSELNPNDLDLESTGKVIGEVRKKLFSLKNVNINDARIINVLESLELPVHGISKINFNSINKLANYIYGLGFSDIEESFLGHPFNKVPFLNGVREFLDSFEENEIDKAAESTMKSINFILEKK